MRQMNRNCAKIRSLWFHWNYLCLCIKGFFLLNSSAQHFVKNSVHDNEDYQWKMRKKWTGTVPRLNPYGFAETVNSISCCFSSPFLFFFFFFNSSAEHSVRNSVHGTDSLEMKNETNEQALCQDYRSLWICWNFQQYQGFFFFIFLPF